MITDSFDNLTPAIIERRRKENAPKVDAWIKKEESERNGGGQQT